LRSQLSKACSIFLNIDTIYLPLWTLAILAARNPPEWAENWVIHATQPLRGKLPELEKAHSRGFLPRKMAKPHAP